jgi:hypothetical protein
LVIGLLNSALPFTPIAYSELRLPASRAAILNSTTPLFTALAAVAWGSERLTGRKIAGVLLGMAGVAVLVGGAPLALDGSALLAVGASLLAALSYGTATVYAARHVTGLPAALKVISLGGMSTRARPASKSPTVSSWTRGCLEQHVIGAVAVERRVEVDQIDRGVGHVFAQDGQVVAVEKGVVGDWGEHGGIIDELRTTNYEL